MKKLLLILLCVPMIGLTQKDYDLDESFENTYKIEFKGFSIEIEGVSDSPIFDNGSKVREKDTVKFEIMDYGVENRHVRISECELKNLNIQMAYEKKYIFSWGDGKHREYKIDYIPEYRLLDSLSGNIFKTLSYTSSEIQSSNLTIYKLIEMMRSDGLDEVLMNTRISEVNSVHIGSYILKISGVDIYDNPYSKVLIFNMVFGC